MGGKKKSIAEKWKKGGRDRSRRDEGGRKKGRRESSRRDEEGKKKERRDRSRRDEGGRIQQERIINKANGKEKKGRRTEVRFET